jgi:hypothetical protein
MPPSSFKAEAGAGDLFCHFTAAFWANINRLIGKLPAQFKLIAAGVAFVFVNRHL